VECGQAHRRYAGHKPTIRVGHDRSSIDKQSKSDRFVDGHKIDEPIMRQHEILPPGRTGNKFQAPENPVLPFQRRALSALTKINSTAGWMQYFPLSERRYVSAEAHSKGDKYV